MMKEQQLYDKYLDGRHRENHPTIYAERFIDFLKKSIFDALIVDVGCGDGRDVNAFSKEGFNVLWIDYSENEINIAYKKFPEQKFEVQNAEELNFEDNSIWAFFMINVIHYVDKKKAIQEILRTLKPNWHFFIHFNIDITDKNWNIDYHHDQEDIMELVKDFKIIHQDIFERIDQKPVEHKHKIIELILQKNS